MTPEPLTIKRLEIAGYKSIYEAELELGNLNVLIGANGSGKSNLMSVFELFGYLLRGELQRYIRLSSGAHTMLHFGGKTLSTLRIGLDFGSSGHNAYHFLLEHTEDDALRFTSEVAAGDLFVSDKAQGATEGAEYREALFPRLVRLGDVQHSLWEHVIASFKNFGVYHFNDTGSAAPMKMTQKLHDNRFLRHDGSNLAPFLYYLQQREEHTYRRIVATVQLIAPFFQEFHLEPIAHNPETIRLEWFHKDADEAFDISQMPDGILRMACLATLLMQPQPPRFLVIDEVDIGLHPVAVEILASLLQLAAHKSQVVVATHSVDLMSEFEPEQLVVVDQIMGKTQFKRFRPNELDGWLEDYNLGDLWLKNVTGGNPHR